jgi:hypothetical protein
MTSHSEKYARLIKSNTLYSSTESNPGCEDATIGVRCKTKAEIITSRRFKRESIADRNRNRFDVDLYDELSETLNMQKKLTRIIKAADDDEDLIEREEEYIENEVDEEKSSTKSTTPAATTSNTSFKTTPLNVTRPSPSTLSSVSNLSRANTIASNNRKKLLDEWRKKREENEIRENSRRPVFKVCHVDVKDYALPHTTPSIANGTTQMPTSQFTFKVKNVFSFLLNNKYN